MASLCSFSYDKWLCSEFESFFLKQDFSNAHMIMYSEKNFGSKGSSIDVLGIVANLKETGYGVKTQSINVLNGV